MELQKGIESLQNAYDAHLDKLRTNKFWQLQPEKNSQKNICYIVYDRRSKLYKIGITNDLITRWRGIGSSTGTMPRVVLAVMLEYGYDEPANELESFLHKYFKSKRQSGEWFELSAFDIICFRRLFWAKVEGESIIDNIPKHLTINPTLQISFH